MRVHRRHSLAQTAFTMQGSLDELSEAWAGSSTSSSSSTVSSEGGGVTSSPSAASSEMGSGSSSKATSVVRLYHQTSPEVAAAILSSGVMKPGCTGYGGAGTHMAFLDTQRHVGSVGGAACSVLLCSALLCSALLCTSLPKQQA